MPAAVSSAIEERRRCGMNVSETRTGNLSILNGKGDKHQNKEYAAEAQNKETDRKLQAGPEERKLRFSESAIERTSTKLSMVGID